LTIRNFLVLIILFFSSFLLSQTTNFSLKTTSFIQTKPKSTISEEANLQGSMLDPKSTFSHEVFLNTSIGIKNKFSTYLGLGIGFFNAAYRIKTSNDFFGPEITSFGINRVSYQLSRYFVLKSGVSKAIHISDRSMLQLSIGGRTYYTEKDESEFGLLNRNSAGLESTHVLIKEITNENNNLDFSIDLNLSFERQILESPLHWSIGLTYSKGLTELWSGSAKLEGISSSYELDTSNKLTFVGLELGITYRQN